jgi:hypothetical protein
LISDNTYQFSSLISAAINSDDEVVAVWRTEVSGNDYFYAQKIDLDGNTSWGPTGFEGKEIVDPSSANISIEKEYVDGDYIYLLWLKGSTIYGQKIDTSDGSEQWTAGGVEIGDTGSGDGNVDVNMSSNGNGGMYVVWTTELIDATKTYAQGVNSSGSLMFPVEDGGTTCNSSYESSCSNPTIQSWCEGAYTYVSGEGGAEYYDCIWDTGLGSCSTANSQCSLAACNPSNYEGYCSGISDEVTCNQSYVYDSEGSPSGNYNCSWTDTGGEGSNCQTTSLCSTESSGGTPSGGIILNDGASVDVTSDPHVTAGESGEMYAIWSESWNYAGEGIENSVRYQKVDTSGNVLFAAEGERLFAESWMQGSNPSDGVYAEGIERAFDGFVVLMLEEVNTLGGALTAQLFNSSGVAQWGGTETVVAGPDGITEDSLISTLTTSNNAGGMLAFWNDKRDWATNGNTSDVYGQYISPVGRIANVAPGIGVYNETNPETDLTSGDHAGEISTAVRDISGSGRFIASIPVAFNTEHDWSNVSAGAAENKSFFHMPGGITAVPGVNDDTYTLYVPIPEGNTSSSVRVCPNAVDLDQVTLDCADGDTFEDGQTKTLDGDDVTAELITLSADGKQYWKVTGVTGTGGQSITGDFDFKDTLTRLEISQDSDHTVEFGSLNGLETSGDTIEIEFDPTTSAFDLSSVTVSDIDLAYYDTATSTWVDLTLASSADATHWGASITGNTLTFTHPTDGTFEDIPVNSAIIAEIGSVADGGSNQITNPPTVNEYELHITNTYAADGGGVETGEIEIPIIDDDTVNVTGYIDTVMTFDIDTATSDTNCDASGASACDSYGGAGDGAGYVVDLGELTLDTVNESGDIVTHADGNDGVINSIYFDLETNAVGGAVVTVESLYEGLYKDDDNLIPSVTDGGERPIVFASGLYGINHISSATNSASEGTMLVDEDCNCTSGNDYYCDVADGGTPITIVTTDGLPVDDGRVEFMVGAAPDSADGTGTYTDQLTFVATATF